MLLKRSLISFNSFLCVHMFEADMLLRLEVKIFRCGLLAIHLTRLESGPLVSGVSA